MSEMLKIHPPYLLFVGDVDDEVVAKTGFGIAEWRRDDCVGQMRLPGCGVDLGLPDVTLEEAVKAGARTLIVGVAPAGGALPVSWIAALLAALEAGLDIASGLHTRIAAIPNLRQTADELGRKIIDVRQSTRTFPVGTGLKRPGKRLLTVGTDSAVGKKYTALSIHAALRRRGLPATFRATGQTGILIGGGGIAVDAVIADFISGAAETLSPAAAAEHWDVIEGQGCLLHPAYAGVSLGLLFGSQPDVFVVCHEPTRRALASFTQPVPAIHDIIELTIRMGRQTNPKIRCIGASINTAKLEIARARDLLSEFEHQLGVPCTDPIRFGVDTILDALP